jgi:CopG family transcriptional regulator/antitoxin EndoAI
MISLPDHLLQELDSLVDLQHGNRSEMIREAMNMYIHEHKKRYFREMMTRGYAEMGNINLMMASEAFAAETEADYTVHRLVSGVR